jgi:hypothetical protein
MVWGPDSARRYRMDRMRLRPAVVPAIVLACAFACGGRVDSSDGRFGGSGNADSGVGPGGVIGPGGSQSTGGSRSTGGRRASGGVTGSGGIVIGSCSADFCAGANGAKGCCMTPNGPCGLDYGTGCGPPGQCRSDGDCFIGPVPCVPCPDGSCRSFSISCQAGTCATSMNACPEVPAVCTENFCPPVAGGKGCCLSPIGPCGVDYGRGCEPPCTTMNCQPPEQTFRWRPRCVPSICRDAGPTLSLCKRELGQVAEEPCSSPGELCTETYGCTSVLICATPETCPTPL